MGTAQYPIKVERDRRIESSSLSREASLDGLKRYQIAIWETGGFARLGEGGTVQMECIEPG